MARQVHLRPPSLSTVRMSLSQLALGQIVYAKIELTGASAQWLRSVVLDAERDHCIVGFFIAGTMSEAMAKKAIPVSRGPVVMRMSMAKGQHTQLKREVPLGVTPINDDVVMPSLKDILRAYLTSEEEKEFLTLSEDEGEAPEVLALKRIILQLQLQIESMKKDTEVVRGAAPTSALSHSRRPQMAATSSAAASSITGLLPQSQRLRQADSAAG